MKVFYELTPRLKDEDFINKLVLSTLDYIDGYDIPESPLAMPAPNSALSALYIRLKFNVDVIPHIRLYDINKIALLSITYGLTVFGINKVVLTRGDKPKDAVIVDELRTEDAVELLKSRNPKLKVGSIISLRYSLEDILKRLNSAADFFLILRFSNEYMDKYEELVKLSRKLGKELYVYVIIATKRNLSIINRIGQPYIKFENLDSFLSTYHDVLNNIIVSIPGDHESVVDVLKVVSRYR